MESSDWRNKRDSPTSAMRLPNQKRTSFRLGTFGHRHMDGPRSHGQFSGKNDGGDSKLSGNGGGGSYDSLRKPINDAKVCLPVLVQLIIITVFTTIITTEQAIEEGRRLYVGNMPYEATIKDVEKLFEDLTHGIEAINMSVDPMTGRNPSYCFIDFKSRDLASQAMAVYNGREFMRRPLKVKPGIKSGTGTGKYDIRPTQQQRDLPAAAERWTRLQSPEDQQDATNEGRRIYIGNLPRLQNYTVVNKRIRHLLKDFNVITVSKLISPVDAVGETSCYCFVDLATYAEADQAIRDLDGVSKFESCPKPLKVSRATGTSKKLGERRRVFFGGLPSFPDQLALEVAVRGFFEEFEVISISKLFFPRDNNSRSRQGKNDCFCFVEIETEEETDQAIAQLDGKDMWGGKVRVKPSTSIKSVEKNSRGWDSCDFL
ncbi:hypothetical protein Golomagni_05134 [Golovinomyces magnicellulatus]|nr:hypothetical protein Golomagni_05134 [Golovinomyces magnicellulatus]